MLDLVTQLEVLKTLRKIKVMAVILLGEASSKSSLYLKHSSQPY